MQLHRPQAQLAHQVSHQPHRALVAVSVQRGGDARAAVGLPRLVEDPRHMLGAIERRNMALFTPVGQGRQIAALTLGLIVEAILDGDSRLAGAILDQIQPESPDNSVATVASCIGIALGLLDEWLSGQDASAPANLAAHTALPNGHWTGKRAAADVLVLAGKGRAFRSLRTLITGQGSPQLLAGSALALAAATDAWARHDDTPRPELIRTIIR